MVPKESQRAPGGEPTLNMGIFNYEENAILLYVIGGTSHFHPVIYKTIASIAFTMV